MHLRLCLSCGEVNCCDSSPNKHATKHFHASGHPLVQSFQPGEDWIWCYVDEIAMEPGLDALPVGRVAPVGAAPSRPP